MQFGPIARKIFHFMLISLPAADPPWDIPGVQEYHPGDFGLQVPPIGISISFHLKAIAFGAGKTRPVFLYCNFQACAVMGAKDLPLNFA